MTQIMVILSVVGAFVVWALPLAAAFGHGWQGQTVNQALASSCLILAVLVLVWTLRGISQPWFDNNRLSRAMARACEAATQKILGVELSPASQTAKSSRL